jgi:hypothetical protein
MRSVQFVSLAAALLIAAGCDDDPLTLRGPDAPTPPTEGAQAFLQVDDDRAQPGERVNVYVKVQFGSESDAKLGSYTGRLDFDPDALGWLADVTIDDGLRVVNPNDARTGVVRFAGASARGFEDLTLYHGVFEVRDVGYANTLSLEMEELSQALTLTDMEPSLRVQSQIFLRQERQ